MLCPKPSFDIETGKLHEKKTHSEKWSALGW